MISSKWSYSMVIASKGQLPGARKVVPPCMHAKSLQPCQTLCNPQFSQSVQSLSRVRLFVTSWIAVCQASLSITNSRSSLRLTSIESVMPPSHLILCRLLLLLTPIPPSIRVFSNESTLRMRWPKYCSFSFSIIPSKEIPGLISFNILGWPKICSGFCML